MKTEQEVRDKIVAIEEHMQQMIDTLSSLKGPGRGKVKRAHLREFAIEIRTLYEDVLNEKIIGIARDVLYS